VEGVAGADTPEAEQVAVVVAVEVMVTALESLAAQDIPVVE